MKHRSLFVALVLISLAASSQELYLPRNIKKTYKKETRSMDGMPGKNYWQNKAVYDITLTVMPPDRNIKGSETITYFNNSPDTLRSANFKLFLNIHKPGAPRNGGAGEDYLNPGVVVDAISVNGQKVNPRNINGAFTNTLLQFPKALMPRESVKIDIEWHYAISLESSREGMIDSTSYFFAYFYPRVAVYDDYNGWDRMNFMDSHEFYSDFNDYTVTVNVPKNFIVWGTGTLQQPEKLLQPTILNRFKNSMTSDEVIRIVTKEDLAAKNVTTQNAVNSWQFKATNIPDMAFGISDHYVWDGTSVIVDDLTKRRASAQAAYNDTAKDFHYVAGFARNSLQWYSHNLPGIPYPYEKTTVYQGYADMEYPMMANNSTQEDTSFSRFVADHEIVHTYMPFYMGINETRYGFMDEGWATFFEYFSNISIMGEKKANDLFKAFRVRSWINDPSQDEDIPIITPGDAMTGRGFGNNEYGKAALGYMAIKEYLGDELFKKCLHGFMNRWNGKHPLPWDFFNTFNDVSGKNLNWFWNAWFFSNNYIDLSLKETSKSGKNYKVSIENLGGMPAPVNIVVTYADGTTESFHQSPAIWQKDIKQTTVTLPVKKEISSVSLDGGIFMDYDMTNNKKPLKGF